MSVCGHYNAALSDGGLFVYLNTVTITAKVGEEEEEEEEGSGHRTA